MLLQRACEVSRFNIICAIAVSLPTYSKIKLWQRATKVLQNSSLTLCKMQAYAGWPEHALSPIGGAESRCPLLSAIRACGAASSITAFPASKTW
jgi:hypothetical protein